MPWSAGLQPYLERSTSPESQGLRTLTQRTRTHDWTGQTGESSGGFGARSRDVVRSCRGQGAADAGARDTGAAGAQDRHVHRLRSAGDGRSAAPGGTVTTCEIDPQVAALANEFLRASPAGSRIDIRIGPARDALIALAADGLCFDVIFFDADKAGYVDYFRAVLDLGLLSAHGLLCVDNTMMQGEPWTGVRTANGVEITRFNDVVAADRRVEQVMLPLRDGLSLVRLMGARP